MIHKCPVFSVNLSQLIGPMNFGLALLQNLAVRVGE